MASITMKQGEAKTITFTVTDSTGTAVDCSSTTLSFKVVDTHSGTEIFSKADADFDKTDATTGIITINVTATNSDVTARYYISELKIIFSGTNIDKSIDIDFIIDPAA